MPGECRHAWRIEEPNGRTSVGVCSRCGEEREFENVHVTDRKKGWINTKQSTRRKPLSIREEAAWPARD